jgi:signal peptidase I
MKRACILLVTLIGLYIGARALNLVRPFKNSGLGMVPSLNNGDFVLMEGFTYLFTNPKRGDLVVFKTKGIPSASGEFYIKRIIGKPNETLHIESENIYINEKETTLNNEQGRIKFVPISKSQDSENIKIPPSNYFVLGDNGQNSFDSRFFGCVPEQNIIGKICFRYFPLDKIGFVK